MRRFLGLSLVLAVLAVPIAGRPQTAKHVPSQGIALGAGLWVSLAPLMLPGTCGYLLTNGSASAIQWQLGPTSASGAALFGGGTPGTNADAGTTGTVTLSPGASVSITVTFVSASQGTTIYVRSASGASDGLVTLTGGC